MMSESIFTDSRRRGMSVDSGKKTEEIYLKLGYSVLFLRKSLSIDEALKKYLELRSQFANFQGTGDNLLASRKVAALYIWTLTDYDAFQFFSIDNALPKNSCRVVLTTFMYFVIYGILEINPQDMDESVHKDLEYCLLKEPPGNLE
jgi:hypothetical protein